MQWQKVMPWFCRDEEEEEEPVTLSERCRKARSLAIKAAASQPLSAESNDIVAAEIEYEFQDHDEASPTNKSKRAKLSPMETSSQMKTRAIKGWLPIIMKNPQCSKAGKRMDGLAVDGQLQILARYVADKAGSTVMQRLGPIALLSKWNDLNISGGWPPTEEMVIRYTESIDANAAKTRVMRLLESIKFMAGSFQFPRSVLEIGDSRYLAGMALQRVQEMPKLRTMKALTLEFICRIEHMLSEALTVTIRMVAGGILILVYFRSRINDADIILSFCFFETRICMEVQDTKTSRCREVVILMSPVATLTGKKWLEEFFIWRQDQGAPLGEGWPLFPSRKGSSWIKSQSRTADVNEIFWSLQVRLNPLSIPERKTSHACKHALLDAAVIFGIDKQSRQALGYHKDAKNKSVETYAPSTLLAPILKLDEMIIEYAAGRLDPDKIRTPKPRKLLVAHEAELDMGAHDQSSSVTSSQEESEGGSEASAEIQDIAQEEIAEACTAEVQISERLFINMSNNKRHKGRINDDTLTACGNPLGTNIIPLAAGMESEEVDAKFICSNCFGRSIEKRKAIARCMSDPTEPLINNLKVGTDS